MRSRGGQSRWGAAARVALLSVVVLLLLASQAGRILVVERPLPEPDAFIVLASHEWERFPALVRLLQHNSTARVFLTEPVRPTPVNCAACGARVGWLASLGIDPARVVILPRRVVNTYDEARAAADYVRDHPLRQLVVVTSPYHTRRALATFRTAFAGTGVRVGVHAAIDESGAIPPWWWSGGYDRWYVAYESAAVVWYAVRYGISPVTGAPS